MVGFEKYTEGAMRAETIRKSKKITPERKWEIIATVRASMDTPCDIGLPWVTGDAERLVHQLIDDDGTKGIGAVEEEWVGSIFGERTRVFSIIRQYFCDPAESVEQGLNRRLGLTLRPSGQYNKSQVYCDQLFEAYQKAWSVIQSGYKRPKEKHPEKIQQEKYNLKCRKQHIEKHQQRLIKAGAE